MSWKVCLPQKVLLLMALCSSCSRAQAKAYDIGGKVLWPGMETPLTAMYQNNLRFSFRVKCSDCHVGDEVAAAKIKLILSTNGEIVRYGWTRGDGRFNIPNIPVGSHLLEVSAIGLLYPEVRDTAN